MMRNWLADGFATMIGRPSVVATSEMAAAVAVWGVPRLSRLCAQMSEALPWDARANAFSPLLNARSTCVPARPATTGRMGPIVVAPAASRVVCGMPPRVHATVKVPAVSL